MAAAEKLSITLPRELAEMVRSKVRAGDYTSSSEVIRDALRFWQEREEALARRIDARSSPDAGEVFADFETRCGDE